MMTGHLYRYTELPFLLAMLSDKAITLPSFQLWEDKNDVHFMDQYSRQRGVSVCALCFTEADETFHHWKLFASSKSGVRITFDKEEVSRWAADADGLVLNDVEYLTIRSIRNNPPPIERWPFVKRYPYQDEREVRLLYECENMPDEVPKFNFDLSMIKRVTLSPWLHKSVRKAVEAAVRSAAGGARIKVSSTTLVSNEEWMRVTEGQ